MKGSSQPLCVMTVDIWSHGCTVVEMWSRSHHLLFLVFQVADSKYTPEIPAIILKEGKDFQSLCLNCDLEQRPSITQLLGHPFVHGHQVTKVAKCSATPLSNGPSSPLGQGIKRYSDIHFGGKISQSIHMFKHLYWQSASNVIAENKHVSASVPCVQACYDSSSNQTGVAYLSPRTIGLHAEAEMKWPKHWHVQTIEPLLDVDPYGSPRRFWDLICSVLGGYLAIWDEGRKQDMFWLAKSS